MFKIYIMMSVSSCISKIKKKSGVNLKACVKNKEA